MINIILALTVALAPGATDITEAKNLYQEGTVFYEATSYPLAIEKFTEALALLGKEGAPRTRLSLLYNIASAHHMQFSIDHDVGHLRQALSLYLRYRDYVRKHADTGEELQVESRIAKVQALLSTHARIQRARKQEVKETLLHQPAPPPRAPQADSGTMSWQRARSTGIGLTVAGGIATVGGAVLVGVGTQMAPRAQRQVDELMTEDVPMDHPAWAEGNAFVDQERKRGRAMLGSGVAVGVVGLVGVGVGTYYLVRAKKLKDQGVTVTPTLGPSTAGIQIGGRF